jgi:hypothetical protein
MEQTQWLQNEPNHDSDGYLLGYDLTQGSKARITVEKRPAILEKSPQLTYIGVGKIPTERSQICIKRDTTP